MISESENEVENDISETDQDAQMAFVVLLSDYKILFDKRKTPAVVKEKDLAAKQLAACYSKNLNKEINAKQVLKKINNMKTKVKAVVDRKRTGNKKIMLSEWQEKFVILWEDEKGDNPVLQKVPGAISAGVPSASSEASKSIASHVPIKQKKLNSYLDEPAEFRSKSLQQLQRECLIQQINAARAQEAAAKEMEKYYRKQNSQFIVFTDLTGQIPENNDV